MFRFNFSWLADFAYLVVYSGSELTLRRFANLKMRSDFEYCIKSWSNFFKSCEVSLISNAMIINLDIQLSSISLECLRHSCGASHFWVLRACFRLRYCACDVLGWHHSCQLASWEIAFQVQRWERQFIVCLAIWFTFNLKLYNLHLSVLI
jgi:hypothetical protein